MEIFGPNAAQVADNALYMSKMERQREIEQNSVRDGCVRWCRNTEYQQATDTKPYRNLLGLSLTSLADAIRVTQDSLLSKKAKLPAWGVPMIVEPCPWSSLSKGGYWHIPMTFLKRQTGKRPQKRLEKADLSLVRAAMNAMQNTAFRISETIDRLQREAWAAGLPFFDITSEEKRKGTQKTMMFRFAEATRLLPEGKFYFPWQMDHRGRAYPVPPHMNPQSDHIGQ